MQKCERPCLQAMFSLSVLGYGTNMEVQHSGLEGNKDITILTNENTSNLKVTSNTSVQNFQNGVRFCRDVVTGKAILMYCI